MVYLEREGWVWYLQSLSQREALPRQGTGRRRVSVPAIAWFQF